MKGVIIGGGIIGMSIARELHKEGVAVAVVEKNKVGRGASWTAGGMLAPQAEGLEPGTFLDFCLESRDMYEGFVRSLEKDIDMNVGYWKCGIFCPAFSEEEEKELKSKLETYINIGLTGEWVDRKELENRYPSLGREVVGGVLYPDDAQVDNRLVMLALEKYAKFRGIELLEFTEVKRVLIEKGKFKGVETSKGVVEGDFGIITAGAWSERFIKAHIFPIKGEMAAVDVFPEDIDRVFFGSKAYLIPRKDYKRLVIGATEEMVNFDEGNTVRGILQLLGGAVETLPHLKDRKLQEVWYGYRPATPDLLPVLGRTDFENLYIASGHYRNGILLAPITARLMTELILKGVESRYLQEFSINRFRKE
ncbi:glycine oxidase ThiO [Persephonella sp.]